MKRSTFALSLALALAMTIGLGAEVKAACPTVSCSSAGNPGDFIGTFGCTLVSTSSSGLITVSLLQIASDGNSNITAYAVVNNSNNGSGNTFVDWNTKSGTGTYCLNTDLTGYIFPPASAGICPFAIFVDISGFEVRLLDSTQNNAGAAVCELQ